MRPRDTDLQAPRLCIMMMIRGKNTLRHDPFRLSRFSMVLGPGVLVRWYFPSHSGAANSVGTRAATDYVP
eukprot:942728-Rhodomonas_salina.2